jgi:hypothetical protein
MQRYMITAIPRRQVLGTAVAAAVAFRGAAWSRGTGLVELFGGRPLATMGAELTLARFQPHIGDKFAVRLARFRWAGLTLLEARGAEEAFSLVFATNAPKRFDSGTLVIDHRGLGTFPLFLVAVGRAREGQRYQAIIDRRVPAR